LIDPATTRNSASSFAFQTLLQSRPSAIDTAGLFAAQQATGRRPHPQLTTDAFAPTLRGCENTNKFDKFSHHQKARSC
jgi:hypothetical protein